MLQNAYFLAKIGADTAENEQHLAEICQKLVTTLRAPALPPGAPQAMRDGAGPAAPADARGWKQKARRSTQCHAGLAKLGKLANHYLCLDFAKSEWKKR